MSGEAMRRIFAVIRDDEMDTAASRRYNAVMTAIILLSLLPLCFKGHHPVFAQLEVACTVVFIVDYLLRWACANLLLGEGALSWVHYPFTTLALVDLLSIVPTFLPAASQALRLSRLVRLMRVMRAAKLVRHSRSIQLVARVLKRERSALLAVLVLSIGYVFISALLVFNVEPETFDTFFDALYWAVISLSTIGYGDVYTSTVLGRAVSMVSALMGIAIVALPSGIITAGFVEELKSRDSDLKG